MTTASVRADGPDPCGLLERDQIEPVFGAALKDGRRMGQSCKWKAESGSGYLVLQLELRNGRSIYDFARRAARGDEELPGIGDQAFHSGLTVGVRLGDRFLSVVMAKGQASTTPRPPEVVALAKQAIRRLSL